MSSSLALYLSLGNNRDRLECVGEGFLKFTCGGGILSAPFGGRLLHTAELVHCVF